MKTIYIAPETFVDSSIVDDSILIISTQIEISEEEFDEGYVRQQLGIWEDEF